MKFCIYLSSGCVALLLGCSSAPSRGESKVAAKEVSAVFESESDEDALQKSFALIKQTLGAQLPIVADEASNMVGVGSEGRTLFYDFVLHSVGSEEDLADSFLSALKPNLLAYACSDEGTMALFQLGGEIAYRYTYKDGVEIGTQRFSQADCVE